MAISTKQQEYMQGILEASKSINLTAIKDPLEFEQKHILDSLSCLQLPEFQGAKKIADVGTGAGFPGIPLAIEATDKRFTLIDSTAKKLKVIADLADRLDIENVEVVHARAEELGNDAIYRETFDLVVSRAVAELNVLVEWCLPLVRIGGAFVAYKGERAEEELAAATGAIEKLGGRVGRVECVDAACGGQEHKLIVISKEKATPVIYPRSAGKTKREPL